MHDQVQLEHSKFTYVVQAQLQLEVQLEIQLLVTALLLVGIVSSSCSDSELNFGSVVGDSEDLKLKFKFKLKVASDFWMPRPGSMLFFRTLHSELLESDSESVLVSYSDSARGSESLSLSESSKSYYSESSYFLLRVLQVQLELSS